MIVMIMINDLYLWVSSSFFGSIEHLQSRLGQSLALVQDGHLLLVVMQLGSQAHRGHNERFKVTGQLGYLEEKSRVSNKDRTTWL